jgi:hypothetical protein
MLGLTETERHSTLFPENFCDPDHTFQKKNEFLFIFLDTLNLFSVNRLRQPSGGAHPRDASLYLASRKEKGNPWKRRALYTFCRKFL